MTIAEKYFTVFSVTGEIQPCGRKACKRLMAACQEISTGTDFGNYESGYLNEKAVKYLAFKLGIISEGVYKACLSVR